MKDLEKYFQDKDSIVRAQISFYRAKMGDRNVVPILKELTGHPEQSIRSTAYEFLGALWSPETIDFLAAKLTAHLETLSAQDVLKAIAALDLVPNEKRQTILKAALRPAMESSNPETALKGFLIAMRVGNAEANHLLVQLFDYKNPQFKMEVLDSVRYYLPDTICRIIMDATIPDKTRERILNQLADCSCRDESTLPLKIEDELYAIAKRNGASDKVKQSIVAILRPEKALKDAELCGMALKSEYPNNLSSQPILSALESGQTPLSCRIKIARNLRDTTDPEAIERIKLLTKDKDPVIRAAIAETLGEISSSLSIPELEKLLHDSDPNVRQAAHSAIAIIQTN